jgi:hypothetical protein
MCKKIPKLFHLSKKSKIFVQIVLNRKHFVYFCPSGNTERTSAKSVFGVLV